MGPSDVEVAIGAFVGERVIDKFNFWAVTRLLANPKVTSFALFGTTIPAFGFAYFSAIQLGRPSDTMFILSPENETETLLNQEALESAVCIGEIA